MEERGVEEEIRAVVMESRKRARLFKDQGGWLIWGRGEEENSVPLFDACCVTLWWEMCEVRHMYY